ncbi:MAG: methylmalonyl-CoA mutase family protein [Methyloceanibacter sp.]|uniref:methylmalonyl-CoA mutase family protein n=1 Tax=Methyloceanibacter sp. TaxID=1965321 RepID=UPI003D6CB23C
MAELPLARDFPAADEAEWKALVEEALKGAPLASLRSETYDGIVIEPLYARAQEARVVPGRTPGTPWAVMQRVEIADPAAANAQILEDLNNGANGFSLVFQGSIGDYGYGLPPSEALLKDALKDVHLEWGVPIELQLGPRCKDAALMLANHVQQRGIAPSDVNIRFGFDPIGVLAANGWNNVIWPDMSNVLAGLAGELVDQGFTGPMAAGDGRPVHAAGGSEAQELAFALSAALAYVRAMHEGGIPLDAARRLIFFRLAADQNQFLTIAKFRAIRKLWSRVEEACGLTPEPAFVAAETAWRMMTKRDPHGNIVRGTIAALAASVGGANAVTVLPFSAAVGLPDAFARRIARNTQTILLEESNLYRVADPSAGSGAIESLTDQLCRMSWWFFQKIEGWGGPAEALRSGRIQRAVARVRAERETKIAHRIESLVGTTDFPDLDEAEIPVLDAFPSWAWDNPGERMAEPLHPSRLATPFEEWRMISNLYLAGHGDRPKIFLACLGRPADFNARASFAKSLFEAGGIEAIAPETAQSRDEMLKAFKASGTLFACLCSSDKVYDAEGADAVKALAKAGAKHIYVAGKPGASEEALRSAGVEAFVSTGANAHTTFFVLYAHLGY